MHQLHHAFLMLLLVGFTEQYKLFLLDSISRASVTRFNWCTQVLLVAIFFF